MQYLANMTDEQTLVLYSGHPLGLFPSNKNAPRLIITNGMMIPNYSKPDDWEKFNALGVTQYGQMTAGSFMYIGPQGIVHGTTITILNAARKIDQKSNDLTGKIFVTSGLGGMSGAQPKAAVIANGICIVAEINPDALEKRFSQGWVDKVSDAASPSASHHARPVCVPRRPLPAGVARGHPVHRGCARARQIQRMHGPKCPRALRDGSTRSGNGPLLGGL